MKGRERMNFVEPIRNKKKIDAIKKLMKGDEAFRDLLLFVLGINSGLRISDLIKLKWKDFMNNKDKLLKIGERLELKEQKTDKTKVFVINRSIHEAMSLYAESLDILDPEDWVFKSQKKSNGISMPISRVRAWQVINHYASMIGIKDKIGTHTLRKTFGYHLYKKGVNIEYIQKMLNHSSAAVTLRYIGITQEQLDEIYVDLNL